MTSKDILDVAVIGGGIGGVACLGYAKKAGLTCRAFERQSAVGGLWGQLPAWQDIQIGAADWALGPLALESTYQPDIQANIRAWVTHFGLDDLIALGTPVRHAAAGEGAWTLETDQGSVRARHLIAATGAHNAPFIPPVRRQNALVTELHSSALREPEVIKGRSVIVVGGGASAFDLLDLCFQHGAQRVAWVHRDLKWFMPTRKPKAVAGSLRGFARIQMSGLTAAQQSSMFDADLRARYLKMGLESIVPARPFNVLEDQLIPGRFRMIDNFASIRRHRGCVASIRGHAVTLDDGTTLDADLLLWGTGYSVDLSYFASPAIAGLTTLKQLRERCVGLVRSIDAPNLYFPSVFLDGVGSSTFSYAVIGRTLAAHICGRASLDLLPVAGHVNHLDLVDYLAERDPESFSDGWRDRFRDTVLNTPDDQPYPLP